MWTLAHLWQRMPWLSINGLQWLGRGKLTQYHFVRLLVDSGHATRISFRLAGFGYLDIRQQLGEGFE